MIDWTLLFSAASLLLICSPQASSIPCNLTNKGGFLTNIVCSYTIPTQIRVKITGLVSKPMVGWQASLQPINPGMKDFNIVNVSLGEIVNQSNTNLVFSKRLDPHEKGDSFKLQFTVISIKQDSLFPAIFQFMEPVPPPGSGMCSGEDVADTPGYLEATITNTSRKLSLDFRRAAKGHSPWIYCKLHFRVSCRIVALENAKYVKGLVIARSSEVKRKSITVVVFEILGNYTEDLEVYQYSLCRSCHVDPKTGKAILETPAPATSPWVTTMSPSTTSPSTNHTEALGDTAAQGCHGAACTNNFIVPSAGTAQFPKSTDPKKSTQPVTDSESFGTTKGTTENQLTSQVSLLDSSGKSASSPAVWIGVAAASAGALLVLLIVVAVWIVSRRQSATASQPQLRSFANSTSSSANNGRPLVNYPQFPCIPHPSEECPKNGLAQYPYEELDMYRAGVGNYDPLLGDMLPGQRLQYLDQYGQQNGTVELELRDYNSSSHPDDPFTTEPGYMDMNLEKHYVEMVSPTVKKTLGDEQFDQHTRHEQSENNERSGQNVQEVQEGEDKNNNHVD